IADADVSIPLLSRSARTDTAGRFRFDSLPPGKHLLQIRALGFQPRYAIAQVAARDTAEGEIRLSRTVANLDTVVVKAQAPAFMHYAEFERRRQLGFGHFITYDQLEKQRGRQLSDVLRTTPGIRVQQIRVGRSGATGYVAVSSRSNCLMQVYIDGVKVADR